MAKSYRDVFDNLEENVTNTQLVNAFSQKPDANQAARVFNLLKTHDPEQLTNEDRMEATKILKFILPEISIDEIFERIEAAEHEAEQKQIAQTTQRQSTQQRAQQLPQPNSPNSLVQ